MNLVLTSHVVLSHEKEVLKHLAGSAYGEADTRRHSDKVHIVVDPALDIVAVGVNRPCAISHCVAIPPTFPPY